MSSASQALLQSFSKVSNNRAYDLAYDYVLHYSPAHDALLGNDQRELFMPVLADLCRKLDASVAETQQLEIFDVGAGEGNVVDMVFGQVFTRDTILHIEEPNPILLKKYKETLQRHSNFKTGILSTKRLQDFYDVSSKSSVESPRNVHLVTALHMIYHLTDYRSATPIYPTEDLIHAMEFLYSTLAVGGSIFLVYADETTSLTGQVAIDYYKAKNETRAVDNLKEIFTSRNDLLLNGGILQHLKKSFPEHTPKLESTLIPSCFYAKSKEEIGAMSLVGELINADDEEFEVEKLAHGIEYVEGNTENLGISLVKQQGKREGMLKVNQPQVVVIITKH